MEEIVQKFIDQYNIEYDFYINLSRKACEICEKELISAGIKAITSWRAKKAESLKAKLLKRDKQSNYKNTESIRNDIADFAGVRIALYFPNEREAVDRIISASFDVKSKKQFPDTSQNPTYKKRFSGYWATHYRVMIKNDPNLERYFGNIIEIQVASVLMHSWSEIEHDLVYKPNIGNLSEEELQILDEINGLVLVGEIALERLQVAIISRTSKKRSFDNSFELKNYLTKYINNINSKDIGNLEVLNEIINSVNYNSKSKLEKILKNLNYYVDETVAEEIIDNIVVDIVKNESDVKNILKKRKTGTEERSGFELFLRLWILLERIHQFYNSNKNEKNTGVIRYDSYLKEEILSRNEVNALKEYKMIRNEIIHGVGMYKDDILLKKSKGLMELIKKLIDRIGEKDVRIAFKTEYEHILTL